MQGGRHNAKAENVRCCGMFSLFEENNLQVDGVHLVNHFRLVIDKLPIYDAEQSMIHVKAASTTFTLSYTSCKTTHKTRWAWIQLAAE